jgi:putative membrane protein
MKFIAKIVLNAVFFYLLFLIVPDYLTVDGLGAALAASLLFAMVNAFLRQILILLTLPLNILTYSLFSFIINCFLIYLVSAILRPSFGVSGFWQAVLIAILFSVFNLFLNWWLKND